MPTENTSLEQITRFLASQGVTDPTLQTAVCRAAQLVTACDAVEHASHAVIAYPVHTAINDMMHFLTSLLAVDPAVFAVHVAKTIVAADLILQDQDPIKFFKEHTQ